VKARKASPWTPERRVKQAELIRSWRPWEKSTGPRTEAGKAACARNAYKASVDQEIRKTRKLVNALTRDADDLLREMRGLLRGG
jgi:hypothetical protein